MITRWGIQMDMDDKPQYLSKYLFDWELFDLVLGGKSPIDSKNYLGARRSREEFEDFLNSYGLNLKDPITNAELFGNFQEALQFIRRYFLKEGNPEGIDMVIPSFIYTITDVLDLFVIAAGSNENEEEEIRLWAEIILKVMNTVLHVDKDLRSNYFPVVQTQIFDRFYKFVHRNKKDELFLGTSKDKFQVPLVEYETKSKKSRDSTIIKLLHKVENVAEELFDRVGVRFITKTKLDALRVVTFLARNNIVIPHNIKPSRSENTLLNMEMFKAKHHDIVKMALRNNLSEERFISAFQREESALEPTKEELQRNIHTLKNYRSIQFTGRHLIRYRNPFLKEFNEVRKLAKKTEEQSELAKTILSLDTSAITREIKFFYPFEVQIVDEKSHVHNTEGEASHLEYKRAQTKAAMVRTFKALLEYKGIRIEDL